MKNVIIISTIPIVNGNIAGSSRIDKYARALAQNSKVYLISVDDINSLNSPFESDLPNIFYPIRNSKVAKFSLLKYILFFKRLKIKLKKEGIFEQSIFLLYPSTRTVFDFYALFFIKIVFRKKLYYEVNELRRTCLANRIFSKYLLRRFFELLKYLFDSMTYILIEAFIPFFDGLIVISTNLEKYFNPLNANIIRIPILSDVSIAENISFKAYTNTAPFKIGFFGSISYKKEGFDIFYQSIHELINEFPNIEVHLFGPINNNEKVELLKAYPTQLGFMNKLIYHGVIDQSILMPEIRKMNLLILPRTFNEQTRYGFSTKLSEYLVSGVPVLVTNVSDNGLYIKDGINGYLIEPGNSTLMKAKILYVIKENTKAHNLLVNSAYHTATKEFYYLNYSTKLYNFLS